MSIREYVLSLLQKKYSIDKTVDVDTFNYVESGYVDSLGIIQFIAELEDQYNIEFTDGELVSEEFKCVGGLARIIEEKIKGNS